MTRREFLRASAGAGLTGFTVVLADPGQAAQAGLPGGRMLGTLELGGSGGAGKAPLETLLGSGLDARLFTDLSALSPGALVVPNERFFLRTACPSAIGSAESWTIRVDGLVARPQTIDLDELRTMARPQGTHLLECAGNANPWNFGMIGSAAWDGVSIAALLERASPRAGARRVLVSGVDDLSQPSRSSVPGASWIFPADDLQRAGAFLATSMNGAPLPRDHGLPVRLVVPGWYGCACIKWVDRIEVVDEEAAATSQMQEYASRTHQAGAPKLARDFAPAVIDLAAMPVRVEKWLVDERLAYRVVGVMWGGSKPTSALRIRFRPDEPFVPVSDCQQPATTTTWTLWSHLWRPPAPRRYQIVLKVADPSIRTRRLDLFFYTREVTIDEV